MVAIFVFSVESPDVKCIVIKLHSIFSSCGLKYEASKIMLLFALSKIDNALQIVSVRFRERSRRQHEHAERVNENFPITIERIFEISTFMSSISSVMGSIKTKINFNDLNQNIVISKQQSSNCLS